MKKLIQGSEGSKFLSLFTVRIPINLPIRRRPSLVGLAGAGPEDRRVVENPLVRSPDLEMGGGFHCVASCDGSKYVSWRVGVRRMPFKGGVPKGQGREHWEGGR
jgi:hypothetical protein